jgi:tetratricopeptide (TPR) repeat protein
LTPGAAVRRSLSACLIGILVAPLPISAENAVKAVAPGDKSRNEGTLKELLDAVAAQPASAAEPLRKLAESIDPLGENAESRPYLRILQEFFPEPSPGAPGKGVAPDDTGKALAEVEKAQRTTETLWVSLQGAERDKDWPTVLELCRRILDTTPGFPQMPELYLARARAYATTLPRPTSPSVPGVSPSSAGTPETLLRVWIAYGLALERCAKRPDLLFPAKTELVQVYARTGQSALAIAQAESLKTEFPDRKAETLLLLASVFTMTGEPSKAAATYRQLSEVSPETFQRPDILDLAAGALLASGEAAKAMEEWASSLGMLETLGAKATQAKEYAVALKAYAKLLEQGKPGEVWLIVPERIASVQEASGDLEAALKGYEKCIEEYPDRLERYLKEGERAPKGKDEGYLKNRRRYAAGESVTQLEQKMVRLNQKLGRADRAQDLRRGLWMDLLGYPQARQEWLELARSARADGRIDEALAACLRALKPARTVLPEMAGLRPENQAFLNELRLPQSPEEVQELLALVCSSAFMRGPSGQERGSAEKAPPEGGTTNQENFLKGVVTQWQAAWLLERNGKRNEARTAWKALAQTSPGSLLGILVGLNLAMSYQQEGIHFRALEAFEHLGEVIDRSEGTGGASFPVLRSYLLARLAYGRGLSLFRLGRYSEAMKEFEKVRDGERVLPQAGYRMAQCLEFQGEFDAAAKSYSGAIHDPAAPQDLRGRSSFAVRRLATHGLVRSARAEAATDVRSARFSGSSSADQDRARKAVYLGENRSDLGHWKYNHPGTDGFVLCAMQCPFDIVGGLKMKAQASVGMNALPFGYRFGTSNPQEKARRWISKLDDPSPTALWDPIRHSHTSSNWDDFGEQYAVGRGPDLKVDLFILPGAWRLSLSFINDHNFYEPNRTYTVYLKDPIGNLLAACDVEDQLCGVYKHFAVFGPREVKIHLSRDLSLNTVLSGIFLDPLGKPLPVPDEFALQPDDVNTVPALTEKVKALGESYGKLTALLGESPVEYVRSFHSLWGLIALADSILASADLQSESRPDSPGRAVVSPPKAEGREPLDPGPQRTPSPERATEPSPADPRLARLRASVSWAKWQLLRLAAVSAEEERRALGDISRLMASLIGLEPAAGKLAVLRDGFLESGELGRSELIEDERLGLLLPGLAGAERNVQLRDAALRYYAHDRVYAAGKLRPVVDEFALDVDPAKRAERLEGLAKECREKKAWSLAEMTYATTEAKVPLENRGDEHFRHYFRVMEYQGRPKDAIVILRKHLRDLPDSRWDILWRFNLVTYLLSSGEVDEAIRINTVRAKKEPKHPSNANIEFLIGLTLLKEKKDPARAKERFLDVIRSDPKSYWANSARQMLKQMGEKIPE